MIRFRFRAKLARDSYSTERTIRTVLRTVTSFLTSYPTGTGKRRAARGWIQDEAPQDVGFGGWEITGTGTGDGDCGGTSNNIGRPIRRCACYLRRQSSCFLCCRYEVFSRGFVTFGSDVQRFPGEEFHDRGLRVKVRESAMIRYGKSFSEGL